MADRAARQHLVSAFVSAGATTPDAAIAFVPDDTTLGRYWLDPERLDSFRSVV